MADSPILPAQPSIDLRSGLEHFGFTQFRPGQREAIETLLEVGRLLLVAPTGGGKSLTYQLPASLLPGTALVVSPLVALMHDQVRSLAENRVAATYLASTLDAEESEARIAAMRAGEYKLVFVTPERVALPGFRNLVRRMQISLVAIDEAHCISEWGHDFRPEYLQIGEFLAGLPTTPVLACTATATPVVRDEICAKLGLGADVPQVLRGFARPNLVLRVEDCKRGAQRAKVVDAALEEALGSKRPASGAVIIYAPTRKSCEEESSRLAGLGWRADGYHAGMPAGRRADVSARFSARELEVIVATNAFGMGIDRSDVRAVVHLAPPGSIEAYYQEVGRAGRDGERALGLLLISSQDLPQRRRMIESDVDGRTVSSAVVEHKWNLFLELMRWAEGGSCRHDAILRYFGDEGEVLQGCGHCDVCQGISTSQPVDAEAANLLVRKALSGVARVHNRFGLGVAVKVLRGKADDRVRRAGLDRVRTFGVLAEHPETWLTSLLRRCVTAGWVSFTGGDRPLVYLTDEGRDVMSGERPGRLLLPPKDGARTSGSSELGQMRSRAAQDDELDASAVPVFERLRGLRMQLARDAGVPPYVVASDRTLRDLARLRPRTRAELLMAHGIGEQRADRYGDAFLGAIASEK